MRIDRLAPDEIERFRHLRLAALLDSPTAFGTTFQRASAWTDSEWRRLFDSIVVFVAVQDREDVGMVRGGVEHTAATLGSLWVRSDARGRGLASALIERVTAWATAQGCGEISLQVGTHQEAARRLYEANGFVVTGPPFAYPAPQEHLAKVPMIRDLANSSRRTLAR